MDLAPEPDPQLPPLPRALGDALMRALLGDAASRDAAFAALVVANPAHADALQRHRRHYAQLEHGEPPTIDVADAVGTIPGHRLLAVLGEGGMGTVYRAEQLVPVHRHVAVKVIKRGMDSKAVLLRFEQERQALAAMEHDAIARVFDCGSSDRGQPFFAMELVLGLPIHRFCDERRLALRSRIELFMQVCAGVQHAHQKGVIHRDLKPANLLVSEQDGRAQPKIIDFGLARATDRRLAVGSLFTEQGVVVGTPEYMSPEQAAGETRRIDTRTDVYSLGVILYELLVGALPFPMAELREAGLAAIQRVLGEVEPPKPSTRLSTLGATAGECATRRQTTIESLRRELTTDLDWVVLKAMAKEPERRYASAQALADDLERYLRHEPLRAGPPSTAYRLRKLMRRYRNQMLAATAVLLALLAGAVGTFVQYVRAEARADENARLAADKGALALAEAKAKEDALRSEATAKQRADELEQVVEFQKSQWRDLDLQQMGDRLRQALAASAAVANQGTLETAVVGINFTNVALTMLRENLFDRSIETIDKGFAEQPAMQARLLQSVGDTERDLGLFAPAMVAQQEALAIRRRVFGEDNVDTAASLNRVGLLHEELGNLVEAETCVRKALATRQRLLNDDHRDVITSMNNLGTLLHTRGQLAAAEPFLRTSLASARRILGSDDVMTLTMLGNLGVLLQERGSLDEAEALYREALEGARRVFGVDDAHTQDAISNLAGLHAARGDHVAAEKLYRDAVEKLRQARGDDHRRTLHLLHNYAAILHVMADLGEAESVCRDALEAQQQTLGDDHLDTLRSINLLGLILDSLGESADAEVQWRLVLDGRRRKLGNDHVDTLSSMSNLACLLGSRERFVEAESLHREAVANCRRALGEGHSVTLTAENNLGLLLDKRSAFAEAEQLFRSVLASSGRLLGDSHKHTLTTTNNLSVLLMKTGRYAEAEPLCRDALATYRQQFGDTHPVTITLISNLSSLQKKMGKFADAEILAREALQHFRARLGSNHPDTLTAVSNLGLLLLEQDKIDEAEPLLHEALATRQKTLQSDHGDVITSIGCMAMLCKAQGKHDEAEALYREAVDKSRRAFSDDHPHTWRAINNLATALKDREKLDEAEPLYREALTASRRRLAPDHVNTIAFALNLGTLLLKRAKHDEVVEMLTPLESGARRVFVGSLAHHLGTYLATLGKSLARSSAPARFEPAAQKLAEAYAILSPGDKPEHHPGRDCAAAMANLQTAWHAADPNKGHDATAREWQAKADAPSPEPQKAK